MLQVQVSKITSDHWIMNVGNVVQIHIESRHFVWLFIVCWIYQLRTICDCNPDTFIVTVGDDCSRAHLHPQVWAFRNVIVMRKGGN